MFRRERGRRQPAGIDYAGTPGPERELGTSPGRPPRVTDDDDDGLAGAPVPKRPLPQNLSGGAALEIPEENLAS